MLQYGNRTIRYIKYVLTSMYLLPISSRTSRLNTQHNSMSVRLINNLINRLAKKAVLTHDVTSVNKSAETLRHMTLS